MKKMLITGTTRGIGRCLYKEFSDQYEITTINRRFFPGENLLCDLSSLEDTELLCEEVLKKEFDILINNAGGADPVFPQNMGADELIACSNLNYHSPVLIMHAVLEGMAQRGYGRIVNVSSIAAKSPRGLLAYYGAAKAALEKYTTSLASFYGGTGVTLNCVCPGGVKTSVSINSRKKLSLMQGLEEDYYNERIAKSNGLGRMVATEEVVALVRYLLSEEAAAVSGQTWNICGVSEVH